MEQTDLRLAVLIDADNVPRSCIKAVMEEVAIYGTPTIKRIYGDWTSPNIGSWKTALLENAITPVQQYGYTTGKNSTDSAMIIDAMDILYSGRTDGFCIVSSDSDFTRLAIRLREAGMKVIGLGEKKTPSPFIVACDKFIYIEVIGRKAMDAKAAAAKADAAKAAAKAADTKADAAKADAAKAPDEPEKTPDKPKRRRRGRRKSSQNAAAAAEAAAETPVEETADAAETAETAVAAPAPAAEETPAAVETAPAEPESELAEPEEAAAEPSAEEETPAEPEPSALPAEPQHHEPVQRGVPENVLQLIVDSVSDIAGEDGYAFMGELGNLLLKKQPDFDPRNFGFTKLTPLIKSTGLFDIDVRQTADANIKHIYLRDKRFEASSGE